MLYKRIMFIAEHTDDPERRRQLLEECLMMVQKETFDVVLMDSLEQTLSIDPMVYNAMKRSANLKLESESSALKEELEEHQIAMKSDLIRESATKLGHLYIKAGDFSSALSYFSMVKDMFSSNEERFQTNWDIVRCSVYSGHFSHVFGVSKEMLRITDIASHTVYQARFNAALGIEYLRLNKFDDAANAFIAAYKANMSLPKSADFDIVDVEDITLYAGLCVLGSFGRKRVKEMLKNDSAFKQLVASTNWLRKVLDAFVLLRFDQSIRLLELQSDSFRKDLFLSNCHEKLFHQFRKTCLLLYISPFECLSLIDMSFAFNCDIDSLQTELAQMIQSKAISFTIDDITKTMSASHVDCRAELFCKSRDASKHTLEQTEGALFKASMSHGGFYVGKEEQKAAPLSTFESKH